MSHIDIFAKLGNVHRQVLAFQKRGHDEVAEIVCSLIEAAYESKQEVDELQAQITNQAFQLQQLRDENAKLKKQLNWKQTL